MPPVVAVVAFRGSVRPEWRSADICLDGQPRYRATYYDYANRRSLRVEGSVGRQDDVTVTASRTQPPPSRAEFAAAVDILAGSAEWGPTIRDGSMRPYPPMPPLVPAELPDGRQERTLAVGLMPVGGRGRHEIVGVVMADRRVERYEDHAPPTSLATNSTCGVPMSADQETTDQGIPGQAWITVSRGGTPLWRFLAVRPSASSGTWGSGVELRHVTYRGRSVLHRAHVPILNVKYDGDTCGPYRDWQFQEGMIRAHGVDVAPGFRLCDRPALTILDTGSDTGDFLGVGIYLQGDEVVLVSELEAGWYRYVSQRQLHADGTIRPRFGFDATGHLAPDNW